MFLPRYVDLSIVRAKYHTKNVLFYVRVITCPRTRGAWNSFGIFGIFHDENGSEANKVQ
jgi:hypothetical protein